jgi:hypothetical protein
VDGNIYVSVDRKGIFKINFSNFRWVILRFFLLKLSIIFDLIEQPACVCYPYN